MLKATMTQSTGRARWPPTATGSQESRQRGTAAGETEAGDSERKGP